MPKINYEEYEVLKELDDEWKWIARNEDRCLYVLIEKPVRKDGYPSYWGWFVEPKEGPCAALELFDEKHLFQFIQWANEEPYNIAELIEEYERYEIENIHVERKHPMFNCNRFNGFYNANIAIWDRLEESEETEVKKDIEWFKKELDDIENSTPALHKHDAVWMLDRVHELYNQLDDPEVLSQEWIDEHKEWCWDQDVIFVSVNELQNLLVPKQELPVIPKFVADYIDDRKEVGFPIYQAIRIVRENSRFEHSHLREWLWTNKGQETFVRAWLDGYEVAEEREQKYYVDLESAAYVAKWDGNGQVDIYTDGISGSDEYELHLTEREIKDYDPRFWPFAVKVEALEE